MRLRNELPIFVRHFYILRDERKGSESARVKRRKKRGREDSDPNLGLLLDLVLHIKTESAYNIIYYIISDQLML